MSPSPGDEPQPPESRAVGGLAGVFRLGGGKLAKSPPPIPSPSPDDRADARIHPHVARGLPRDQMELYRQLKSGATLTERVAAANSLRYAIADFPLNPVRIMVSTEGRCVLTNLLRRCSRFGKRGRI
jgi:hypothetical protein